MSIRFCAFQKTKGTGLLVTGDVEAPERSWFKPQIKGALSAWIDSHVTDLQDVLVARKSGRPSTHQRSYGGVRGDWRRIVRNWRPLDSQKRQQISDFLCILVVLVMAALIARLYPQAKSASPQVDIPDAQVLDMQLAGYMERLEAVKAESMTQVLSEIEAFERLIEY